MGLRPMWKVMAAAAFGASAIVAAGLWLTSPGAIAAVALASLALVALIAVGQLLLAGSAAAGQERRRAELAERLDRLAADLARERDYAAAFDEPLLAISPEGVVMACNSAAEQLLGFRRERVVGRPVDEAFTLGEVLAVYERARRGEHAREQVRVARPEGARYWEVSAAPVEGRAEVHSGVLLWLRDITEEAITLQVKTDFVANASHELRTPIAAARMAMETLDSLGPEDGAMRERLMGILTSNIARLEEMARDLLDLSKLESADAPPERQTIDTAELVEELRRAWEPACAARKLTLSFDFAVPRLESDRGLLLLILGNLIDNAAKFAFEGTAVRVTARPLANGKAGGVRLEVIDKGVGIPLEHQQRIFERYYQVDGARTMQTRRGSGLGLSIVKHAVRRLGGTIRVQSVWQQGTTMTVEVPG